MKLKQTMILFLTITLGLAFLTAAQTPRPSEFPRAEVAFEELPVLNASEILRPEFLKGTYFTVREKVPTYSGANQFTIDSDFGVFEADGKYVSLKSVKPPRNGLACQLNC